MATSTKPSDQEKARLMALDWLAGKAMPDISLVCQAFLELSTGSSGPSGEPAIKPTHEAADAFWRYWRRNGDTHVHGYYESTWGAINAALRTSGVVQHEYGTTLIEMLNSGRDATVEKE